MAATYKVWLEMSSTKVLKLLEESEDPIISDEPYWERLHAILASLAAERIPYEITFDNDNGRDYALVHTMAPQLTLEDLNVNQS